MIDVCVLLHHINNSTYNIYGSPMGILYRHFLKPMLFICSRMNAIVSRHEKNCLSIDLNLYKLIFQIYGLLLGWNLTGQIFMMGNLTVMQVRMFPFSLLPPVEHFLIFQLVPNWRPSTRLTGQIFIIGNLTGMLVRMFPFSFFPSIEIFKSWI